MADDRTFLVTGANRGIGYATAEALAAKGHRVILTARDLARGEDAEEEIRRATGNPNLYVVELDLASLAGVRHAAADILDRFDRLDVLINNAGVFTHDRRQSEEGLELQFAVNHLGHFLLTVLLRSLLVASTPARIITISSRAHFRGAIDLESVAAGGRDPYDGYQAYADSKLANVLFTLELARRLDGTEITSNTMHPGTVETQMLTDYLKAPPVALGEVRSPALAAVPLVRLATDPDLAGVSGRYFEDLAESEASAKARGAATARRLWNWSVEVTGAQESDWGG